MTWRWPVWALLFLIVNFWGPKAKRRGCWSIWNECPTIWLAFSLPHLFYLCSCISFLSSFSPFVLLLAWRLHILLQVLPCLSKRSLLASSSHQSLTLSFGFSAPRTCWKPVCLVSLWASTVRPAGITRINSTPDHRLIFPRLPPPLEQDSSPVISNRILDSFTSSCSSP